MEMITRSVRHHLRAAILGPLLLLLVIPNLPGQTLLKSAQATNSQPKAGGRMEFEVASIRPDRSDGPEEAAIMLTQNDSDVIKGGLFHARARMARYIEFAYKFKPTGEQRQAYLARLPAWVSNQAFVIDARAPGDPTKDQMRMMMQSLLAERFNLKLHFAEKITPVFALKVVKVDMLGPNLRLHSVGPPCTNLPAAPPPNTFPPECHDWKGEWTNHGQYRVGGRDVTISAIASSLTALGRLGRPVIDDTGLKGTYDFIIEWEFNTNSLNESSPEARLDGDVGGSDAFLRALKEQLGLILKAMNAPVRTVVIDHVESPTPN